jgi:flagellar basal body P-ring formation protein FlgA
MLVRSLTLLAACAFSCVASASPLAIALRADAVVANARVTLADVAAIDAQQPMAAALGKLELAHAPRIGYTERLTRAQLEQIIRRHAPADTSPINWSGAYSVSVRTRSQAVAGQLLMAAATDGLQAQFAATGLKLAAQVLTEPADIDVPAGHLELRVRPLPQSALSARMPLWVDLVVDGAVYRSVVVPLAVTARRQAYVAAHAMESGAWVTSADFTVADASVAGINTVKVEGTLAPFRLRQELKAGQPLATDAVNASGRVLRGDQVRLVVSAGQIGIETSAIAMAEGAPGQLIAVRPLGAKDIVTGRVSQSGSVTIE